MNNYANSSYVYPRLRLREGMFIAALRALVETMIKASSPYIRLPAVNEYLRLIMC